MSLSVRAELTTNLSPANRSQINNLARLVPYTEGVGDFLDDQERGNGLAHVVYTANDQDRIVGVSFATLTPTQADDGRHKRPVVALHTRATHPDYRRQGVQKMIIDRTFSGLPNDMYNLAPQKILDQHGVVKDALAGLVVDSTTVENSGLYDGYQRVGRELRQMIIEGAKRYGWKLNTPVARNFLGEQSFSLQLYPEGENQYLIHSQSKVPVGKEIDVTGNGDHGPARRETVEYRYFMGTMDQLHNALNELSSSIEGGIDSLFNYFIDTKNDQFASKVTSINDHFGRLRALQRAFNQQGMRVASTHKDSRNVYKISYEPPIIQIMLAKS